MKKIEINEAKVMLRELLENTLYNRKDVDCLMHMVKDNVGSIPMKAIRQHYDNMEKRALTAQNREIMDNLVYFFGP